MLNDVVCRWCENGSHPHLHPDFSRIWALMLEPTKPLMMKGRDTRLEARPRHFSVVISAITICVRSCKPLCMILVGSLKTKNEAYV